MAKRPNFLFIMTDQHRADWLGCTGHPVVRTAHLDALAARGTRFDRFYVASPVCMPNRASLMTGRFPSVHGLRYNGCVLSRRANTFVDVLRASGYRTAAIGKSHLQPFSARPPVGRPHFATGPLEEAWQSEAGDCWQEQPERYAGETRYEFATPYYGFDHVDMVLDHGDQAEGHYLQWLREQTPDWAKLRDRDNQLPHNYACPQAVRTAIPESLYSTSYIRDQASQWLAAQADAEAPFFAFVSFPDPHHPFTPPGHYWDMYDPDDFELALPYSAHRNPPMPMRTCMETAMAGAGKAPLTPQTAFALTDERQVREAMALTAGMITMIDDAVGGILGALQASGRADDTVVCFNADHGDYLGDFNLMLKGALSLESINRVPFIWADPADPTPRTSRALASTVDIASTVLARADIGPYFGMQGQSLLPCIAGSDELRESLLIEFNDGFARMGFSAPARVRTLMTDDWRFSVYAGQDWGELYDRRADPHDTHNLWDEPAYAAIKATLSLALNQQLIANMDESPRSLRLA